MRTIHGQFAFDLQRFKEAASGQATHYFQLTGPLHNGSISQRLLQTACFWANRVGYRDVTRLLKERGAAPLPPQTVHRCVQQVADEVAEQIAHTIEELPGEPIRIKTDIDLYDPKEDEVLVMEDGILVKAQKPERKPDSIRPCKRIQTDVVKLERPNEDFLTLVEGPDEKGVLGFSVSEHLATQVRQTWKTSPADALPIVVISDGASSIRKHVHEVFGSDVVRILDWYHLVKRSSQELSGVARSKPERNEMLSKLTGLLWEGKVADACEYLSGLSARKEKSRSNLVTYLTRHRSEIIDYKRRKEAGKTIGSGRMEKGVDQVIGHRQKKKGCSWSRCGSRSLAHLRAAELNGTADAFWQRRVQPRPPR